MRFLKNFMMMQNKKLVTHNGSFHADDIFACATLSLLLEHKGESFEIFRTRDPEIIKNGDYVFDVGGLYDPEINRFDHHQIGGAGKRDNGIEYASIGLVWKKYGEELCGSKDVANIIDEKIATPVDAADNGIDIFSLKYKTRPYTIQNFFYSFYPRWKDQNEENLLSGFLECVNFAKGILFREIAFAKDLLEAQKAVRMCYEKMEDKRIIVLDENYPSTDVLQDSPEPLFIVYPRSSDNSWGVKTVRQDFQSFRNRKDLPSFWAGLKDKELQAITGVPDAVFCHRALFLAVAKSKEGAIKLAQLAL